MIRKWWLKLRTIERVSSMDRLEWALLIVTVLTAGLAFYLFCSANGWIDGIG